MKRIIGIICALSLTFGGYTGYAESSGDTVFFEDFEDFEVGEFPFKMSGNTVSYYQSSSNNPQNVIEVGKDESNALKFIVNTETLDMTKLTIPIGTVLEEGSYDVSFDFRAENNSRYFERFFQLWNKSEMSEIMGETRGNYCFPCGFDYGGGFEMTKDKYINVKYSINMDERKYSVFVDNELVLENIALYRDVESKTSGISQIVFVCKYNRGKNGKDSDGTVLNPGIYWVDNIKVKKSIASLTESYPQNGAEDVSADKSAWLKFDYLLDLGTVNEDNISLFEDGEALKKDAYSVSYDNAIVKIEKKEGGFDYNKEYKISFGEGVKVFGGYAALDRMGAEISFKTESLIDSVTSVKDGGVYSDGYVITLPEIDGVSYKITFSDEKEYTGESLEIGEYDITVYAENTKNGKSEKRSMHFSVVGASAPEARDVKIAGKPETGSELAAEYTYYDVNGDAEGESEFVWLKSDTPDGEYKVIEGADKRIYTLSEEDENSYIKCGVIPIAENEPQRGECAVSEPFAGSFRPEAKNIKVTGKALIGEELVGSYEYFDLNGDTESESELLWVKDKDRDGKFEEKLKNQNGTTCTIGEEDINCYIKFAVIPKNGGKSRMDNVYYSESVTAPFAPTAKDVKIIGTAKVGQSVGASYTFFDLNGDNESGSTFYWYADGKQVKEGKSLDLDSSFEGKEIYFEIIPKSDTAPFEGDAVKSESVKVSGKDKTKYTGGGGGGSTSKGGGTTVTPPVQKPDDTKTENPPKEEIAFEDIKGHWAEKEIKSLAEKKIVSGVNEKEFKPDGKLTRAEMGKLLANIIADGKEYSSDFADVDKSAWYYGAVSCVSNEGIMRGDGENFRPNDFITREEAAVCIVNLLNKKGISQEGEKTDFADFESISAWARESVKNACGLGIISGYPNNEFKPKNLITRAEAAVLIGRMINITKGDTDEK